MIIGIWFLCMAVFTAIFFIGLAGMALSNKELNNFDMVAMVGGIGLVIVIVAGIFLVALCLMGVVAA